jgi:hypothetical protein
LKKFSRNLINVDEFDDEWEAAEYLANLMSKETEVIICEYTVVVKNF